MLLEKRKIILLALIGGLFIFVLAYSTSKITIFSIYENEEVDMPAVNTGEEVSFLGYKFSNTSGTIISTKKEVVCEWKPDNIDDGWKKCYAIFEVENFDNEKQDLFNPKISFNFQNDEDIRNVVVSYSSSYVVIKEEYPSSTLQETDFELPSADSSDLSSFITARAIDEAEVGEESSSLVLVPENIEISKRSFSNFNELNLFEIESDSELNVSLSGPLNSTDEEPESNASQSNESIITLQPSEENQTSSEEIDSNETQNNVSTLNSTTEEISQPDFEEYNETISEQNETVENATTQQENISSDSSLNFISGLAIEDEKLIETSEPFAFRIDFETPKYSTNQFDFEIIEGNFGGYIDPTVSSCANLNSANGVYTLTGDVFAEGTCFTFQAENITLDCAGHSVNFSSSSSGYGAYSNFSSSTVKNCHIKKTSSEISTGYGIYFLNSENSLIEDNTIQTFGGDGTSEVGILIVGGGDNTIENNSVTNIGSLAYGIELLNNTDGNTLNYNSIVGNTTQTYIGYYVGLSSDNNTFLENSASSYSFSDSYGFFSVNNQQNIILGNTINVSGSYAYGINIEDVSYTNLIGNFINNTGDIGNAIHLNSNAHYSNVTGNVVYINGYAADAILIEWSDNGHYHNNSVFIYGSSAKGLFISQSENSSVNSNSVNTMGDESPAIYLDLYYDGTSVVANSLQTFGSQSPGIYSPTFSNYSIFSNNIRTYGSSSYGIILISDDTILRNNTIQTHNFQSHGIYLEDTSAVLSSFDDRITLSGQSSEGIILDSSNGNYTFTRLNIQSNNSGSTAFYLTGSSNSVFVTDSILNASYPSVADLYIESDSSGGNWSLTNVTFHDKFFDPNAYGNFTVSYYFKAHSNYTNSSFAPSVQIIGIDVFNQTKFNETTDSLGQTPTRTLVYYVQTNSTNTVFDSPHNITATLNSTSSLSSLVNLSMSTDVFFTFSSAGIISSDDVSSSGSGGGGGVVLAEQINGSVISEKKEIPARVELPQRKVLFDINFRLLKKEINSGENLLGAIGLINVGEPGKVETRLSYNIASRGKTLLEEQEIVQVETQKEFIKEFDTSKLEDGEYELTVDLKYEGQLEPAHARTSFVLKNNSGFDIDFSNVALYLSLFVISLAIIVPIVAHFYEKLFS